MQQLGAEGSYLDQAVGYTATIVYGTVFFVLTFFINALLNSVGDTYIDIRIFHNIFIIKSLHYMLTIPTIILKTNHFKGTRMNRREAIKIAGVAAMAAAVGTQVDKMEEQYMNRIEMKPKDPANLDKGELKHSPLITI